MVGQFGSREICDVTFKSLVNQTIGSKTFAAGQPVFVIDTATTSNMEQATNTVYAQGGQGYNRLIAWEGEKTMTFTVTDALMSPMGLKVLSGAGFKKDADTKHIHVTYDAIAKADTVETEGTLPTKATVIIDRAILADELGIPNNSKIYLCKDDNVKPYATILDSFGGIKDWASAKFNGNKESGKNYIILTPEEDTGDTGKTKRTVEIKINTQTDATQSTVDTYKSGQDIPVKLDFYVIMTTGASEITIEPGDFGGNFYVEADTLYRNRAGKDMAATLTFPNVKIQSGFSIAMAANGDPSTFDFVMDAFPAYTYFDHTKKVICDITIVSGDTASNSGLEHTSTSEAGVESSVG